MKIMKYWLTVKINIKFKYLIEYSSLSKKYSEASKQIKDKNEEIENLKKKLNGLTIKQELSHNNSTLNFFNSQQSSYDKKEESLNRANNITVIDNLASEGNDHNRIINGKKFI